MAPKALLTRQADARTRTGDLFITSEVKGSGGVRRRVAGSVRCAGRSSPRGDTSPLSSIGRYPGVWARIGHVTDLPAHLFTERAGGPLPGQLLRQPYAATGRAGKRPPGSFIAPRARYEILGQTDGLVRLTSSLEKSRPERQPTVSPHRPGRPRPNTRTSAVFGFFVAPCRMLVVPFGPNRQREGCQIVIVWKPF